jgi:chloramphenicol-sensitive protein RarD
METLMLSPVAAAVLIWRIHAGDSAFALADARIDVLTVASGVFTTVPLLMFAYGARRIRLATLGLLQYIAPQRAVPARAMVLQGALR